MANDLASLQAAGKPERTVSQPVTSLGGAGVQRDQFLKLLLAQLKHQDPLQAPDASKFTEQMTQFGQLEQLFDLNESLDKLSASQGNFDRAQAIGMIGKQIEAPGDGFTLKTGEQPKVGFTLDRSAKQASLQVLNNLGAVVRSMDLGKLALGTHTLSLDGKDDKGDDLAEGNYRVRISAADSRGDPLAVTTVMHGVVSGVVFAPEGPLVQVNNQAIKMSDVTAVKGV